MAKKDISKVISKGSPKQRLLILSEDIARSKFNLPRLLTDKEFNELNESFKTPYEIKLYRKFKNADATVLNALTNIQGLLFEVKMHYSDLRGYILVWNTIENAELLVNSVLHEIKSPEERRKIAEHGARGVNMLLSQTSADQEGYINIDVDFARQEGGTLKPSSKAKKERLFSLRYAMGNVQKMATDKAIAFLSWRQAILDYMEETGFDVKTYREQLDRFTDQIYTPVITWDKYKPSRPGYKPGEKHPRLNRLRNSYSVTPDIESMEIDRQAYTWFKTNFLGDE